MEDIEALHHAGRWFVAKRSSAAEGGSGAAREGGIMLYVPFFFELCGN